MTADFTYQQSSDSFGVTFQDTSTGSPTTWSWDFGDGSPLGTTSAPVHEFAAPGTYAVALTVGDGSLVTSSTVRSVDVLEPGTATPKPTPTSIPTPTPPPSPSPTPDPTATPSPTPTPTPTPTASPDPVNCTGYAEPRVMLETQDWWTQPGAAIDGGSEHIHLSTCFPVDQVLSGIVPFDLHVQLHMNPGRLTKVSAYVFGNGVSVEQIAATPNYTCPTVQCDLWYRLDYDTTRVPSDGYLEFRFHARVIAPDGSEGYTSTGWQATLANGGRPTQSYRTPPFTEARGWYTGTDYQNARFTSTMPTQAVSGVWTCNVKLAPGSGGTKTTHVLVTLDPRFHADPVDRGQVVFETNGPYQGPITIDTRNLPDGPHRLLLRTDSTVQSGTGSGVLVIPFRVDNGGIVAAAVRLSREALDPRGPVLPLIALLFVIVINLPWRPVKRVGRPVATQQAIPIAAGIPRASAAYGGSTSKDATWTVLRRALADRDSRDSASAVAREWLESVDRREHWG